MKTLAIALLLGAVSSTNLVESSIWDESIEESNFDICSNHWERWKDHSNSWDVYQTALSKAEVYEDPFFEANMDSVFSSKHPPKGGTQRMSYYNGKIISWMRPIDIYPDDWPELLGKFNKMVPQGIKQGSFSDCWFLAGATALVEQPWRLNRVIHKNSRLRYNHQGIFRYYFWNYKEWVPINIDDRLPVKYKYTNSKDYFVPMGADRSNFGALWIPLLEKAYAKLNGNYDRIEWGTGFESLRQLSNKPVYFFNHKKLKKTEKNLYSFFNRMANEDYPMVTSCCGAKGKAPDGLQNAHAYSLLDVTDFDGVKLAKLRNPWSSEGYNGKFNDDDPFWTEDRLKKAGHVKANDGVFFMPFEKFIEPGYFRDTSVTVHTKFEQRHLYTVKQTVSQKAIHVTIPSKQKVYFTFEKENPRFMKNCAKDNTFINMYFFKGKQFPGMDKLIGKLGYIGHSMYHTTLGFPDMVMEPGVYTLYVANWEFKKLGPVEYTLQVYQDGSDDITVSY